MQISLRLACAALFLAATTSSCVFAVGMEDKDPHKSRPAIQQPGAAAPSGAGEAQGAPAGDAAKAATTAQAAARKAEKREREIAYARLELKLAELDAERGLKDAARDVERARQDLESAQRELKHFQEAERTLEQEDQAIDLARSAENAVQQKQELEELMAMYKADEYAELTKELVVRRGRFALEMAERTSALAQKRAADKKAHVWPTKERELALAVKKAEAEVDGAEAKLAKTKVQNELELLRARHKLADAERPDDEVPPATPPATEPAAPPAAPGAGSPGSPGSSVSKGA